MKLRFPGQYGQARSTNVNAKRLVNLYPEVDQEGKNPEVLYGTPGLTTKATATAATVVRGEWANTTHLYVACGNQLYRYDTSYAETTLGTLNTSSGRVLFAENPTQVIVVDGTDGYIVTKATGAFAVISDADFTPLSPTHVVFVDTYFIVIDAGTQRFYISSSNDGTAWDALDFASAEGFADNLIAVLSDHRELWLFGDVSTEVWGHTGAADFPFERVTGAFIEKGIAAAHALCKADNSVYWLGRNDEGDGIVWRAEGYTPRRVSTHAVELAIRQASSISDAFMFSQIQDGHTFIWLVCPTANLTFVFDPASNKWHERLYMETGTGNLVRHRANAYAFFNREHIVGDHTNGKLYKLDMTAYSDAGDEMKALWISEPVHDGDTLNRLFHSRFQMDIEAGVGLATGNGSDPQIILRWSDDGGHTWSNEHYADVGSFAAIGASGEYRKRAIWNRLGSARSRIYEVSVSDPVKRVMIAPNAMVARGIS